MTFEQFVSFFRRESRFSDSDLDNPRLYSDYYRLGFYLIYRGFDLDNQTVFIT